MPDFKTSELSALTAPADDDLAMAVDVDDTTMFASGTNKLLRFDELREYTTFVVAGLVSGSGAAAANTGLIEAQLDAAETAGGGVVIIPAGTWHIDDTLDLGSRVVLRGVGWDSQLFLADGASTGASPKPMVKAKANTNWVGVENIALYGNSANQTDTTNKVSHGVDFTRAGTEGSGAPTYDGGMWCRNVLAYDCLGTGFKVDGGATTTRLHHCYAYHNEVNGFSLKTDCMVSDCVAGNNTDKGFYAENGTSILIANCKAFGASDGFSLSYCKAAAVTGCTAEDVAFRGFVAGSCQHAMFDGCVAYRSTGSDNERSGFWIEDGGGVDPCRHIVLRGCSVFGADFGTQFRYGLWTRGLGEGCDFELHVEDTLVGKWRRFSGAQFCRATFNNNYLDGYQEVAWASPFTPDPYAGGTIVVVLGGNTSVNVPSDAYPGAVMRLVLWQDGTGGRTVTWDSDYFIQAYEPDLTAGAVNSIDFIYDGSEWVQTLSPTSSGSGDPTMGGDLTGTASNAQIAAGAIVNADINAAAAIALSKLAQDPLARANHTGSQLASTVSDFDTQVRTSRLDQMAAPTAAVGLNGQRITSLADPSGAQDAATRAYVDSVAQGLDAKPSVRAATTADITLSGTQTVDGVSLQVGDRVLVKDQSTGSQNGIYVVQAGAWGRALDADSSAEVNPGMYVFVEEGAVNADSGWVLTTNAMITLGTTALVFAQFSGAGQIDAGAALTKTGNQLNVAVDNTTVEVNADALRVKADGIVAAHLGNAAAKAIAGLTPAADRLPYYTSGSAAALATFTAAGRALVDDADVPAQRTTLGLGPLATATSVVEALGFAVSDESTNITTGTGKVWFRMPFAMTVTAVRASLNTASSSGVVTVDINENGTSILSTKLTIDQGEKTSTTAVTAAVISDSALADDAEITIDIDGAGSGAKGLKVWIIGTRTV